MKQHLLRAIYCAAASAASAVAAASAGRPESGVPPTIVSKNAVISPGAKLGKGTMIFAQGNVGAARVGNFCLVQANGTVNAECDLGDFCRLDNNSVVLKGETVPDGTWVKPGVIFGEVR